jgi:hypothetical protein
VTKCTDQTVVGSSSFRKRFGEEGLARISEAIALASISLVNQCDAVVPPAPTASHNEPMATHRRHKRLRWMPKLSHCRRTAGKLIVDATCAPADIRYPTDVSLLNEAREKTEELIDQIETFHRRFGFYPESVQADKIYRTRANLAYFKQHGIRISGPPLGRRPQNILAEEKKQSDPGPLRSTVDTDLPPVAATLIPTTPSIRLPQFCPLSMAD